MGKLTPGATLIYESPDKGETVYAREAGTDKKILIGYNIPDKNWTDRDKEKLWKRIHEAARTNDELQSALEKCIVLYNNINTPIFHHPV